MLFVVVWHLLPLCGIRNDWVRDMFDEALDMMGTLPPKPKTLNSKPSTLNPKPKDSDEALDMMGMLPLKPQTLRL